MTSILLCFLIFISVFYGVHSFAMEKPPGSEVEFGDVIDNVQQIYLYETKENYLEIVLVTGGAVMPAYQLVDGDEEAFDFAFKRSPSGNAGEFIGTLLNSVDYEQLITKHFTVRVSDGDQIHTFNLTIVDVPGDEHPEFESIPLFCRIKEKTVVNKDNTTCRFKISNPEKNLDILFFLVDTTYIENFGMAYVNIPNDEDIVAEVGLFLLDDTFLAFNPSKDASNSFKFDIQVLSNNGADEPVTCPYKKIPVIVMIVPEITNC